MIEMLEGKKIYNFAKQIFPYNRSITGEGVRQTLCDMKAYTEKDGGPLFEIKSVVSGTQVFDWTVPKEWIIREAYIEDEDGNKVVDFKENNLHILGYSTAVDRWVDLDELKKYVYTQLEQPDAIPYVTSYYKERYGFCMSENQLQKLENKKYHMYIDSELVDGVLNYAEIIIPGATDEEVFFSTYICHPSMANNECSGPALSIELARYVNSLSERRYTYRFIYIPETIGSITYLAIENHLEFLKKHVIAGVNLSCVGDNFDYSIVETRNGHTLADRLLKNVLKYHTNNKYSTYSYHYRGSDERQYNAPGVDLPVLCFCRSKFAEYKEYHTSADDLNYISEEGFQGSFEVMRKFISALEWNYSYKVTVFCEPQLGKRGLYPTISKKGSYDGILAMRDLIAYADGEHDLIEISDIIDVPVDELIEVVKTLLDADLIVRNT